MVHPKITTCYPSFHTESDTVNTFSKTNSRCVGPVGLAKPKLPITTFQSISVE